MPDDGQELVKAGAEGLAAGATRAFLETLVGPGVELAAWAADRVRFMRWKSQLKMLERAQAFAADHGWEPHRVPLKVLVPLLEGAGLEDEDSEMIDRWAWLLARAAGTANETPALASYASILRELGPAEAALIGWLYAAESDPPIPEIDSHGWVISLDVAPARDQLRLAEDLFAVVAENVIRLGLAGRAWRQGGANFGGAGADVIPVNECLARTALGAAFVAACTPPLETT